MIKFVALKPPVPDDERSTDGVETSSADEGHAVPAPDPELRINGTISFISMTTNVHELLAQLPGDPALNVNHVALDAVIADATDRGETTIQTLQTIIERANTIFHDPIYRAMAVKLLTIVLNLFIRAA
jgi:hypothetical protein